MGEKWPPLDPGAKIRTYKPNHSKRREWTDEGWAKRRWGVTGVIVMHHDLHGLSYDVRHEDGTMAGYDPSEFDVIPHPGCLLHDERAAAVCMCGLLYRNDRYRDVVRAAWELVLRGTSDTIRFGGKEERLRELRSKLDMAGTPAECGVPDPELVYDWRW